MASTTIGIFSVYTCNEDECIQKFRRIEALYDDKIFCAYDIKETTFNDFKSRLEQGYIFIINCKHIHNFVTCFTTNFSEDLLSTVIVGNWHNEYVEGIQRCISLMNAQGEQQFRKIVENIRIGIGEQRSDTEWSLEESTNEAVDAGNQRVPDSKNTERVTVFAPESNDPEETVPKEPQLYLSKNDYSKMTHSRGSVNSNLTDISTASSGFVIVSGNTFDGEMASQHELVTESRFVQADTMLPPDSDSGAGVYVWEQACIPKGRNIIKSADPESILEKLCQDDGDGSFEKQILGQFIPQIGREWGITNLSRLLSCDSAKIRYSVIETIEYICYRHNPSRINPDHFLEAAEDTLASIIRHIGDEKCVAQLSYILLLIFSMVYLQTIARQSVPPNILGEKLQKYYHQLLGLNPRQQISITYFIEFLQYFMQCLVANVKDLNKGHWLQMENWDEILATSSIKTEDIRKMAPKFNPCDRISVLVLLLNVIYRLEDTELPSQLLLDLVKEALHPPMWISIKNRRSRSKRHAIALMISRGCRHILENKSLIEAQANEGLREKIREILLIALDTKEHTKHMVSEELKCLAFYKTDDIQKLVAERIANEGKFTDVCFHYICHNLKRTKVSLHCNNSSWYKQQWAMSSGNLGSMRVKAVCFVGGEDGNNSKSPRTGKNSTHYSKKEKIDYDTREVDNNLTTLVSLQKKNVHSNIVQLIAYQWQTMPKFFVVEEPKGVKLQEYLLLKRNHRDWLSDLKLIFIVKQALCAVQHLHDRYILHRDLTSDRFKICPESLTLKLVDFRIAKETNKQNVIVCLNEETKLAVRWTAIESQVSDKFSFCSDAWMFGHLMLETWTHGCWPFSEHHDKTTDSIMEMVVRGGMKPKQPRCVPKDVFKTMLQTWEIEDLRISTKQLMKDLDNFLEQYSERKGTRSSATQPNDEHYPRISKQQLDRNHEPEYRICEIMGMVPALGVQRTVLSIKITKQKNYYNDELYKGRTDIMIQDTDLISDHEAHILEDTQGICTVSEAILSFSIAHTVPRLQELETLSGAKSLELNYDNDMHRELAFQYPKGRKLRDVAMAMTDVMSVLLVLLNAAKLITEFHNAGWILRSICTFDLWVAEEDKRVPIVDVYDNGLSEQKLDRTSGVSTAILQKVFPLRLSRSCAFHPSEDWVIDDVFRDRQNWLPIETLRDKEYTKEGDVYQFAMTVVEVFNILELSGPKKHFLTSIPFASINKKEELEIALLRGELPKRPSNCPDMLFAVLERCMSRERIRRPKIQDVLSCIETCIHSYKETLPAGIKRQRMSTHKIDSTTEHSVNTNVNSIYKDPVVTQQSGVKFQKSVGSTGINDRKGILSKDEYKYINGPASEGMDDILEENKLSINEDRIIRSKNQNLSATDAEEIHDNPISDSSIVESDEYSYADKENLPNGNMLNSSHKAIIPVLEGCDSMVQQRASLPDQKCDRERHTDIEAGRKTFHLEMNNPDHLPYQVQKTSKKTPRWKESEYTNGPESEGMDVISEENEISINEYSINWSKNQNVSVKDADEMHDNPISDSSSVERDAYSYANKETLPNSYILKSSHQARIPEHEGCNPMLQCRASFPDQKLDRERHTDIEARRKRVHLDMYKPNHIADQIHTTSKKTPHLSMFSKLALGIKRRFGSSKTQSGKPNGDTETRDGGESLSSSDGTNSSSSGESLKFCNDSTSGTSTMSVENEEKEEVVYDEIPEYDSVSFQYALSGSMTYESDTSDGEEQDTFTLKENQDSLQIKQSYAKSATSIVTENDSPLQSGSMTIHTASLDEASHESIAFENDEIYEESFAC